MLDHKKEYNNDNLIHVKGNLYIYRKFNRVIRSVKIERNSFPRDVEMPADAGILALGYEHGDGVIWYEYNPHLKSNETRTFVVLSNGFEVPAFYHYTGALATYPVTLLLYEKR